MIFFVLFSPILCVVVPLIVVVLAMLVYVVAHYCITVPLGRSFQQGDGEAGMVTKTLSNDEDEMDNRAGNISTQR